MKRVPIQFLFVAIIVIITLICILIYQNDQIKDYGSYLSRATDVESTAKQTIIKYQEVICMYDSEYLAIELDFLDSHFNTGLLYQFGCTGVKDATALFNDNPDIKRLAIQLYGKKMNEINAIGVGPEIVQSYIDYRFPEYSSLQ